jgi:spore germination protein GerM
MIALHRLRVWLCCLLLVVLVAGCAPSGTPVPTPTPRATAMPYAPVDDAMAVRRVTQVLYYLSGDGSRLRHVLKTITVMPGETMIEAVMAQLMAVPDEADCSPIFPEGADMYLLGAELSGGVVTVNLTGRFTSITPFAQFAARAAIVNTLTELNDVRYVNVLIDGNDPSPYVVSGSNYLPFGAMARVDSVSSAYAEMENKVSRIENAEKLSDEMISPNVTLYFASPDGTMLLPEVREIGMDCSDMIRPIVKELIRGPSDTASFSNTMPSGLELLAAYTLYEGSESIAVLEFRAGTGDVIRRGGIHPSLMYASLVHTLMTFVPRLSGVHIKVNDNVDDLLPQITEEFGNTPGQDDGEDSASEATPLSYYSREDFSFAVGRDVTLYFPQEDGRLRGVVRVIPQMEAESPRNWLRALMDGMTAQETLDSAPLAFPEQLREDAILGIAMSGETAVINLSENAAAAFQGATLLQERAWLYAMINTLTGIPGIKSVSFLVEGAPVETLGGGIWLKEPLLANPGLIATAVT